MRPSAVYRLKKRVSHKKRSIEFETRKLLVNYAIFTHYSCEHLQNRGLTVQRPQHDAQAEDHLHLGGLDFVQRRENLQRGGTKPRF